MRKENRKEQKTDKLPEMATTRLGPETDINRRTSLGFLRRSKSTEPLGEQKSSRKKMSKTQAMEDEMRRQRESYAPKVPPRLPDLSPAPQLETFGGEERDKFIDPVPISPQSGVVASPSMTGSTKSVDPYGRTESMTHRGRYSYASSAASTVNSPRRVRRRKDPTSYK